MARIARIVAPGYFHHVTQWGNRAQNVFFCDSDKKLYLELLHKYARRAGIKLYAYCLMDNHVNMVVVPRKANSFSEGFGELHREYTNMINLRQGWRGHLWQGRFQSYPFDPVYIYDVIRFVERTPVRRGAAKRAQDYAWSSVGWRLDTAPDLDTSAADDLKIGDWVDFLAKADAEQVKSRIKQHSATGRPMGDQNFVEAIGKLVGRNLAKKKPGPKKIR